MTREALNHLHRRHQAVVHAAVRFATCRGARRREELRRELEQKEQRFARALDRLREAAPTGETEHA